MNSSSNELVTITKLSSQSFPSIFTDWERYKPTAVDTTSIAVGESITGYLINPVRLGEPVSLQETTGTHTQHGNVFTTTPVINIVDDGFITETAVYELKYLNQNPSYII